MRKVSFQYQPAPTIEVQDRNGEYQAFELQASDADIFDRALELAAKYRKLKKDTKPSIVLKALKECTSIVNTILGDGSMTRLSCGKPLCISDALDLMAAITREASASYAERLGEYNE
jgi:hypothetical protein